MTVTRADALIAQEFWELFGKSTPYSLSAPQLGSPTLHDFVRGLILSTNIVERIDKHLPSGYRADWGQVIDVKDGNTLSRECDIIIYKGTAFKEIENRSMRFVLVDQKQTRVVIQVRSRIKAVTKDDIDYCRALKKFVRQVWFVAECCWANSKKRAETIGSDLKKAGYAQFLYLCVKKDNNETIAYGDKAFVKFIKLIKKIK